MLDYAQLEALLAVEETGTFEGAARNLNLSSFAVVQRIKALETKMGAVLIERGPTRTSEAGKVLCDHARQVRQLEVEVTKAHHQDTIELNGDVPIIKIALSDETLSSWFIAVIEASDPAKRLPLIDVTLVGHAQVSDQMRTGEIVAALTNHEETVSGYKTYGLGTLEYQAVANPGFVTDHFSNGLTIEALKAATARRFCSNDDLIHLWMKQIFGKIFKAPIYRLPSSQGTLKACLQGECWAVLPAAFVAPHLEQGRLMELAANQTVTRPLFWHVAGNMVDQLKPITHLLRANATR